MQDKDFLLVEYQEAAKSYANGVDIGFSSAKHFIVINGIFIALFNTPEKIIESSLTMQNFLMLTPGFGVFIAIILFLFTNHYFNHLNNCLDRCVSIEERFGGNLFSGNSDITKKKINTHFILKTIALLFGVLWIYVWYVSYF